MYFDVVRCESRFAIHRCRRDVIRCRQRCRHRPMMISLFSGNDDSSSRLCHWEVCCIAYYCEGCVQGEFVVTAHWLI